MDNANDLRQAPAPWGWVLELAVLGCMTAMVLAERWTTAGDTLYQPVYASVMAFAALGGGVAGLAVARWHAGLRPDCRPGRLFVESVLMGTGLGFLVGALTSAFTLLLQSLDRPRIPTVTGILLMATIFGSCAAVQGGWYVPAASWLRRRGRASWPLLIATPILAGVTMAVIYYALIGLVFFPCRWQHCEG